MPLGKIPGEAGARACAAQKDSASVADIGWEDEPGLGRRIAEDLEQFGEARRELRNRRRDGSLIWCEAHIVALEDQDHGRVWVSVQRDVTARREARAHNGNGNGNGNGRGLGARWER